MKKKVLVTGSCGFIMNNFVSLASNNYNIINVDRINFPNNQPKLKNFYLADIRDRHIIDNIFRIEQPDIVLHGAAETHVDNSLLDPTSFVTSNILGTQVLVDCSIKYNVEKFILISTDEVYGQLENLNDKSWKEESPIDPRNPYSASKAGSELIVMSASKSYGLNYNITRSSNNYGPKQVSEKLIPKCIKHILNNIKIPIYGKGLQIRDWTYVEDNCKGLITVIEKAKAKEIYNISSNQELTNIELVNKICDIVGKGHNLIEFIPDPRKSHDYRYSVDSSKIKSLGWKPTVDLNDGLVKTVNWYLSNAGFVS